MRRLALLAACFVVSMTALLLLAGNWVAPARQSSRGPTAFYRNPPLAVASDPVSPQALAQPEADARRYTVQPMKFTDDGQIRPVDKHPLFVEISSRLQELAPVPDDRLAYFAWLFEDRNPGMPIEFLSWGCLLSDVEEVPEGWRVTLIATARAQDKDQNVLRNRPIDVFWRYLEVYLLTRDGDLQYIQGRPHPKDGDKPSWSRVSI